MRGKKISNLLGNQGSSEKAELKRNVLRKCWTVRGRNCVGCGEEDCSRQEAPEQRTTGDQSPWVSILHWKELWFFFIGTGTESTRLSVHRETWWQIWWQGTNKETKSKGSYLEKYPFFYWEPVKLFEKWCNTLMFAFAKKPTLAAWFWIFCRWYIWSEVMSMSKELQ